MRRLGLAIRAGSYGTNGSRAYPLYFYKGTRAVDPLAFMLEGKRFTVSCYIDYAQEYAIPLPAMEAFAVMITGRDANNPWFKDRPVIRADLKNLAFATYYLTCGANSKDVRYCLDQISELTDKVKMKHLISTGQTAKPSPLRGHNLYRQDLDEFGNRLW